MSEPIRVHVRWMIRRDLPDVLGIETQSFDYPWTEEEFVRALRQRNCIGMVAEHQEQVVGFMLYDLHKTRYHLLDFAVGSAWRRRSVGRQMLERLIIRLAPHGRQLVTLQIRETNLNGQRFLSKLGFRATSVIRDAYRDADEDAYWMVYNVSKASSPGGGQGDGASIQARV